MRTINVIGSSALALFLIGSICSGGAAGTDSPGKTFLTNGWQLETSAKIRDGGEVISTTTYKPTDWHPATVPSTVVGTLVDDQVYPDQFFGMNLRSIPGTSYKPGENFSGKPMPADSPFNAAWWYRREFEIAPEKGGRVWLS